MISLSDIPKFQLFSALSLAIIYVFLLLIEYKNPLRKPVRRLMNRWIINFTLSIMVYFTAKTVVVPVAQFTINFNQLHGYGLLSLLPAHSLFQWLVGFMLMDLTFYYWHRLNHEIPLLWRFHNVHHADPDLDVTTSMRFHVIEIAYSSVFRLIQIAIIGIDPLIFITYEFIFQASTYFQHSNTHLSLKLERILNKIIVTPRMHGIHHSSYMDETNRNYGVVFSFWDKIHNTLKGNVYQNSITIGVPAYLNPSDNTLVNLLLMPFRPQRSYWQFKNQSFLSRPSDQLDKTSEELSE
ncbi:sterol desaturase family protein [Legionella worsleiensis]|uniref:Sterol desaturase n=1 Tax=Legionella worsleiensis TaxID=45076 RepID=A0A0W1ALB6_9GAMM|nr:sterol desaturase family protein [Legionella worsleiensis]KTD82102.1 sterol desaturase [Legionella worsleiensis]STY31463.1 sterol desaturase [Legionella worsleiensis]